MPLSGSDPSRRARLERLLESFRTRYRRDARLGARAPGRLNLIGEHTDYNAGLVLPLSIDLDTFVVAAPRDDREVHCWSNDLGEGRAFSIDDTARAEGFGGYVHSVVLALRERDVPVCGLDLVVESRVPLGAGLSSSAALTVSLAQAFAVASDVALDATSVAEVAHRAESHFMDIGSGILDQYASALCARDEALRIDCRTREVERVALPPGKLSILVADSGVRRQLAAEDSGYRQRVAECAQAVAGAREARLLPSDAKRLRGLLPRDLPALEGILEPVLLRRARHVITENERVEACCSALRAGDLVRVGELIRASHASLRDDYEVSVEELDVLCEVADAQPRVLGSRLTGAGFGGCTIHLIEPGSASEVAAAIAKGFASRFGREPKIFEMASGEGVSVLDLPLGQAPVSGA